jgi:hypothetical protein
MPSDESRVRTSSQSSRCPREWQHIGDIRISENLRCHKLRRIGSRDGWPQIIRALSAIWPSLSELSNAH